MCIKQNSGLLHDVCIDIRFDILVDTEAAWPCLRSQYTTYVNICVQITYRCIIFYGSATAFLCQSKSTCNKVVPCFKFYYPPIRIQNKSIDLLTEKSYLKY